MLKRVGEGRHIKINHDKEMKLAWTLDEKKIHVMNATVGIMDRMSKDNGE